MTRLGGQEVLARSLLQAPHAQQCGVTEEPTVKPGQICHGSGPDVTLEF